VIDRRHKNLSKRQDKTINMPALEPRSGHQWMKSRAEE
jgi:hypothetical protein